MHTLSFRATSLTLAALAMASQLVALPLATHESNDDGIDAAVLDARPSTSNAGAGPEVGGHISPRDRAELTDLIRKSRSRFTEGPAGIVCDNDSQRLVHRFVTGHHTVHDQAGELLWSTRLSSIDRGSASWTADGLASSSIHENRLAFSWGAGVEEWFVNETGGVEHGFTIEQAPFAADSDSSPLSLEIQLGGPLSARVAGDGRSVELIDGEGSSRLRYEDLKVFDSYGTDLPATMAVDSGVLSIVVDDRGATYPIVIDPTIVNGHYLKGSELEGLDEFGTSVSASNGTVVVGAPHDDGPSNSTAGVGAVYVFVRSGHTWTEQAVLRGNGLSANADFGRSVAVSGDWLAVCAPGASGGRVFMYQRSAGTWTLTQILPALSCTSVDIDGLTTVGGAPGALGGLGAAYVWQFVSPTWNLVKTLTASNAGAGDLFGHDVAIDVDHIIVGAPYEAGDPTLPPSDNSIAGAGAAYIYTRAGNWPELQRLKSDLAAGVPSTVLTRENFGWSVAISQDSGSGDYYALVGAPLEDSTVPGIHLTTPTSFTLDSDTGAVFAWHYAGSTYSLQARFKASTVEPSGTGVMFEKKDAFGDSVDIDESFAVVGASQESSPSTHRDNDESSNSSPASGAAYIFERDSGGTWSQKSYLKATNTDAGDIYGYSVAVSGLDIAIGAPREDSVSQSIDSGESDNSVVDAGAAYTVDLGFYSTTGSTFCLGDGSSGVGCPCGNQPPLYSAEGCHNSATLWSPKRGAVMTTTGSSSVALADLVFHVNQGTPGNTGIFLQGATSAAPIPFKDGLYCLSGTTVRLETVPIDSYGYAFSTVSIPAVGVVAPGDLRFYQFWYRDPSPPGPCGTGSNFSSGVSIQW